MLIHPWNRVLDATRRALTALGVEVQVLQRQVGAP